MVTLTTPWRRAILVALQCAGFGALVYVVAGSAFATQVVATIFLCGLIVAFTMHIVLSVATRSSMPGLDVCVPGHSGRRRLLALAWPM
jgi:hypothetical protein